MGEEPGQGVASHLMLATPPIREEVLSQEWEEEEEEAKDLLDFLLLEAQEEEGDMEIRVTLQMMDRELEVGLKHEQQG